MPTNYTLFFSVPADCEKALIWPFIGLMLHTDAGSGYALTKESFSLVGQEIC